MTTMEIIWLMIGIVALVASFRIPHSKEENNTGNNPITEEEIQKLVQIQVDEATAKLTASVDETVNDAVDKAERSLDKLTNEKIMAVSEYSDTVLTDIHKNHEEVVFLYDMLNDKQVHLKNTVREVEQTAKTATKTAKEAKQTAKEAVEVVENVQESAKAVTTEAQEVAKQSVIVQRESGDVEAVENVQTGKTQADALKQKKNNSRTDKKNAEKGQVDKEAVKRERAVPELITTDTAEADTLERNKNEEILAMHKAGKSNMVIARELGLGVGEVKLVIDLFKGM